MRFWGTRIAETFTTKSCLPGVFPGAVTLRAIIFADVFAFLAFFAVWFLPLYLTAKTAKTAKDFAKKRKVLTN